jgi:transglutaminase-like putative cysteine protease
MARELEEAPRSHRLIQIGAVAAVSAAAAIAFGRVFTGHAATWKLVLVGLVSIGIAAALERRSPLLAALISAVGLLWTLGILVFPDTLWYGLPLGSTVHAIGEALARVGHQADVQVAPTPALRPLFMAAVTAVWTAAFSTHALAVRSGSPLLAAAPPAALVAFAGIVLEDGPRPGYAALFLLGVLALLFADGLRRVRQWGPVRPWTSGLANVRRRMVASSTTRGARRVAVTVVGVALLLPGLLPGLHGKAVLKFGASDDSGSLNPLVAVSASLRQRTPLQLFTVRVRSEDATYWRLLSLDRFDGDLWTVADLDVDHGKIYGPDAHLPFTVETLPPNTPTTTVTAEVSIDHTPGPWLPTPYEPASVTAPGTSIRFDASHTSAVPDQRDLDPGFTYRVVARVVAPEYEELNQRFDYSGARYRRDLELPDNLPPDIRQLAQAIVVRAHARSTLEQVLAVQHYLTDPLVFSYDQTVSLGSGTDALKEFLFGSHKGFCQQFASAMGVLLRALGIPTRIAVGYTTGTYDDAIGGFDVTTANAHSWVEVEFPGFGWVPFEPTPTRANPVTDQIERSKPISGVSVPPECGEEQFIRGACGTTRSKGTKGNGADAGGVPRHKDPRGEPPPRIDPAPKTRRGAITFGGAPGLPSNPVSWRLIAGLTLLALAALVLVLLPVVKVSVRRFRVARARGSRDRTLAAFRLFEARAGDLGLGRGTGETPWEYRARLSGDVQLSDGHLDRLARIVSTAAYSPRGVSDEDAHEAGRAGRSAIRDVRRSVGLARRVAGMWRPQI